MLLRARNLAYRAGGAAILAEVSLDVGPGELVALMGRNGAGKSTLMDLLAGLRAPASGEIELDGRRLATWSARERARRVAHLPQSTTADLPFAAEQVVMMGRYPHADGWFESDDDRRAAHRAMARASCFELRARRMSTLSGGERQRVLLAACLAQEPRMLLLDEPSTFLDVDQQLRCFSLLREEAQRGAACVAVTHDVNLALTFATRLVLLAKGVVARDVSTTDALSTTDWLAHFSARLRMAETADGRRWVAYR